MEAQKGNTRAQEQNARALWAVKFVRGQGNGVDSLFMRQDFFLSKALHHVAMENHPSRTAYFRQFAKRLQGAGFVVG